MSLTHFVIPFTPEQLDVVFKHLDMGAHREVRGLMCKTRSGRSRSAKRLRQTLPSLTKRSPSLPVIKPL